MSIRFASSILGLLGRPVASSTVLSQACLLSPVPRQQPLSTSALSPLTSTSKILVTGAGGQIGAELVPFLRSKLGVDRVVATDLRVTDDMSVSGPSAACDVTSREQLERLVGLHNPTCVVHLATLLSAVGERNPGLALKVNTLGIQNVLELAAAAGGGMQVFAPSTIAVFGPDTPRHRTPDTVITRPTTMYGLTKVHQELLGQYYRDRFSVDYRSIRYPGVVSALSPPGGGTTDYAVDIFHHALRSRAYTCFLPPDVELPMMYMPDCLEATWQLLSAPLEGLTRTTYNVTAMSFTPQQLAAAIQRRIPSFTIGYQPDFREAIARSWPASIDDSLARRDWGWSPVFDLQAMTDNMLHTLSAAAPPTPQELPVAASVAAA